MKVGEDIHWIGVRNPIHKELGSILRTEYGTIYNSYLVIDDKICIIDGVPRKFGEIWINKIKELTDRVDYFILTHSSPYKSESLEFLLREFPDVKVLSCEKCLENLRNIVNMDFVGKVVENRERMDIGSGELVFVYMPYWPWPDTVMIYHSSESALFSAGGFSAHYCEEGVTLSKITNYRKYREAFKNYFTYVLYPNKKYIKAGLRKIYALYIERIYPAYGPVIDVDAEKAIESYENWIIPEHREVVIIYVSSYGYTESMARAIARGIRMVGVDAKVINAEEHSIEEIISAMTVAKGILLGTSTVHNFIPKPMMEVLASLPLIPDWKNKKIGIFGSETYSGKGLDALEKFLRVMDIKHIFGKIKVKFKPSPEDLENCREFGRSFAAII